MGTTNKPSRKLESVRAEIKLDTDPNLSYLGKYESSIPSSAKEYEIIDREELGDMGRNECRFFIASNVENEKQAMENYKRMEGYNKQDWCCIGIRAAADILISQNGKSWTVHHFSSGGLWGIESDSDKSYKEEIAREELNSLKAELLVLGFTLKELKKPFADALINFNL
jgi:hypothetical protein